MFARSYILKYDYSSTVGYICSVVGSVYINSYITCCVNVAYNLIKRIKSAVSDVKVVSYERTSELTDEQMELN